MPLRLSEVLMKKFFTIFLCFCFIFLFSFQSFAISLTIPTYKYNENKGGFSIFYDSTFSCLEDLPYGSSSRVLECRNNRYCSQISSTTIFCFTAPTDLIVENASIVNSQDVNVNKFSWFTNVDCFDSVACGYLSDGNILIKSATPILKYSGGQWANVSTKHTLNFKTTDGYTLDMTIYSYSVSSSAAFSVCNYIPYNFADCEFSVKVTSALNAFSYIPHKDELSVDYTSLLNSMNDKLQGLRSDLDILNENTEKANDLLDDIFEQSVASNEHFSSLRDFLENNMYVMMWEWSVMDDYHFQNIEAYLDEAFSAKPSNGFDSDLSKNNTFGDDYFGGELDSPTPDLSSFSDGIGGFTRIYNMLDTAFDGFLSEALVVLLLLAFISYVMGRKVNKG